MPAAGKLALVATGCGAAVRSADLFYRRNVGTATIDVMPRDQAIALDSVGCDAGER